MGAVCTKAMMSKHLALKTLVPRKNACEILTSLIITKNKSKISRTFNKRVNQNFLIWQS